MGRKHRLGKAMYKLVKRAIEPQPTLAVSLPTTVLLQRLQQRINNKPKEK